MFKKLNLATKITLTRIFSVPLLLFTSAIAIGLHYNYKISFLSSSYKSNIQTKANLIIIFTILTLLIFIASAITDHLDGRIARKTNTVTPLGKLLDPIADKLLVLVGLLHMMTFNSIAYNPAGYIFITIIIAREFIISLLRQMAASKNIILQADSWGKTKTVITLITIGFAMLHPIILYSDSRRAEEFKIFIFVLMIITTLITIYSGYRYIVINSSLIKEILSIDSEYRDKIDNSENNKTDEMIIENNESDESISINKSIDKKSHNTKKEYTNKFISVDQFRKQYDSKNEDKKVDELKEANLITHSNPLNITPENTELDYNFDNLLQSTGEIEKRYKLEQDIHMNNSEYKAKKDKNNEE